MKILLVNPSMDDGGVATYASELIRCLSQEHELTVVVPDDSLRPIKEPGVKVLYHDSWDLSKKNALLFIKMINEEVKPDLVISSWALMIPVIVPFINNDIKVFVVSHSGKLLASEYSAFNNKYTDTIIAASSDYNKRYLEKKYHIRDKSKIKVVYNSIDADPELEALRFEKRKNETISIIYAGSSLSAKNPDLVLRIICELLKTNVNFKFYWTGGTNLPIPKKIFPYLKLNNVKQYLQKDDRIIFTGRIASRDEFIRLVSSSNILLSPSRTEGCSMLLLQALRSGSICLVSDELNGNREIVERGNCGFALNHRSPKAFAEKLVEIINHPEEYAQLYDNAYDTYQQKLTYQVWKKNLSVVMNSNPNHKDRKPKVSNYRLSYDLFRMKMFMRICYVRRMIIFTVKSWAIFYLHFLKLKLKGDFPVKSNYGTPQ